MISSEQKLKEMMDKLLVCVCVCVCVYAYLCMYMRMYTYIDRYIDT